MEPKDSDKSVIAKPVHSRLTTSSSNFRPFSELLAGAVTAIRPKIIRLKSVGRFTSVHQAGLHGVGVESTSKTTVVNKSLAKMVSSTTVSQLTDMDISNPSHQQTQSQVEAHALIYNTDNTSGSLEMASENNRSSIPHATTADRPSYDGYNWRKYGEKLIKESKRPRSYYKCNHPSCPVKKTVERSSDGVLDIIYKGEHNHLKPQFSGRNTFGGHEKVMSNNILAGGGEGLNSPTENQNGGISGYCEKGTIVMEPATHEPESKRRINLNQSNERVISGESAQENRFVVQIPIDSVMKGDGFRWRKYGQKIVKGNPYPRSYYRCTDPKCNVRKHVERAADDPSMLITTYEGVHNHEMQIKQKEDNTTGSLKRASENDWSSIPHATVADRPSYDEYYRRKYGEKLVKGSKYPRRYYKPHPSCPVKKTVERSSDGVLETVFEVEDNHLKPQFSGHVTSGDLEKVVSNNLLGGGDDSCGISGDCKMGTKVMKPAAHEPESKTRKNLNQFNERVISGECPRSSLCGSNSNRFCDQGRWLSLEKIRAENCEGESLSQKLLSMH